MDAEKTKVDKQFWGLNGLPQKTSCLIFIGVYPPFSAVEQPLQLLEPQMNADGRRENKSR